MAIRLSEHFTHRKLLKAVFPSILMMVCISVYSIVDGLFVSNVVGESAFAAVNLIWPVSMVIAAIGFMLGVGGSALTAKTLGEGKGQRANEIFSMIVYFTLIVSILISVIVFIFLEPIARALAVGEATEQTIQTAVLYGKILIGFQVAYMIQNVFQSFFVVAERAMLGFIVTALAGVTNMVLDWLFIAVLEWGVVGAAVATGLSQTVGAVIPIFYFLSRNGSLLRLTKAKIDFKAIWKSSTNGSSELLSNIAMSVISMLFNIQLLKLAGESGVAAYGVIMYAGFIFCAIFIGYSIGVAPIVGFHFGAGNDRELKSLFKKSLGIILLFSFAMVILTEAFAGVLSGIFVGYNAELHALTTKGFRLYGLSFGICGFNIFASGFFTALNDGLISALVSFSRTVLFQVIFILLLPALWGINGVWLSVVIAELCSLVVSLSCFIVKRKKYRYA